MKKLINFLAISLFSLIAKMKGYRFSVAATPEENSDADQIFTNEGYKLPGLLEAEMAVYKKNSIKFIAYHKGVPVGTVGLADPKVTNRPFDLHGVDEKGDHFEIQSLIVSKNHRECSQLVFLGLFKEMYTWSVKHSVKSWISFGLRQLYITIRRYNKSICHIDIARGINKGALAMYLYENNVFDSCSIMQVADFEPGRILLKFLRKQVKKTGNRIRFFFL